MWSNRLAFAALAVACIGAAAGGGYVASRQTATPAPLSAETLPATTSEPLSTPVQETEGTVNIEPVATAPAVPAVPNREPAARAAAPRPRRAASPEPREALPTLDRSWPSSAQSAPSTPPAPAVAPAPSVPDPSAQARSEERPPPEPPRAPEVPQRVFEELVVSADSVIGLQAETTLNSETARVEDRVEARVTRDVRVNEAVAIPAGARAIGSVTNVERGGRFKERARLGIRFHTLVLADGSRLPISTDTVFRDGAAPGNGSAAKIGGAAVGGAILGAILGGGKGAVIGATTGAGAGAATVMASDRNAAVIRSGEPITVRVTSPIAVTVEK